MCYTLVEEPRYTVPHLRGIPLASITTRVPWCERDARKISTVSLSPTKGLYLSHEHVQPFHDDWENVKGIEVTAVHA